MRFIDLVFTGWMKKGRGKHYLLKSWATQYGGKAQEGRRFPAARVNGEKELKLLLEQHQDGLVEFFYREVAGRRGEDRVVTCDGAEDPFRFA